MGGIARFSNGNAYKCAGAVLIEWLVKKVKPVLYFKYQGYKPVNVPVSVAYALVAMHEMVGVEDAVWGEYGDIVMRTVIDQVANKLGI
jgi:hypothetical protein